MVGGGVESLTSGAPNEVCRRKRDPKRFLFESSEFLDANDPVLEMGVYFWSVFSLLGWKHLSRHLQSSLLKIETFLEISSNFLA